MLNKIIELLFDVPQEKVAIERRQWVISVVVFLTVFGLYRLLFRAGAFDGWVFVFVMLTLPATKAILMFFQKGALGSKNSDE